MQFRIRHTPGLWAKTANSFMHAARSLGVWVLNAILTPKKGIITEVGHIFFITEDGKYIVQE